MNSALPEFLRITQDPGTVRFSAPPGRHAVLAMPILRCRLHVPACSFTWQSVADSVHIIDCILPTASIQLTAFCRQRPYTELTAFCRQRVVQS